jgi:hypothetical protein
MGVSRTRTADRTAVVRGSECVSRLANPAVANKKTYDGANSLPNPQVLKFLDNSEDQQTMALRGFV